METNDEMQGNNLYYTDRMYYEGSSQYESSTNNGVYVSKPNGRRFDANGPLPKATMNESESNGFATASLILGVLSIIMLGIIQGILAIIFGCISIKRKQRNRGCALAGIITGSVGIILFIGIVVLAIIGYKYSDSSNNGSIADKVFTCSDGSEIVFSDDEFTWYKEAGKYEDNYRYGTYRVYYQSEAEDVLYDELSSYSVTEEEIEDYFNRNDNESLYTRDNFCVLILNNTGAFIDGADEEQEAYDTPYMGFIEDGYYEAANMNSGNYAYFTEVEY